MTPLADLLSVAALPTLPSKESGYQFMVPGKTISCRLRVARMSSFKDRHKAMSSQHYGESDVVLNSTFNRLTMH